MKDIRRIDLNLLVALDDQPRVLDYASDLFEAALGAKAAHARAAFAAPQLPLNAAVILVVTAAVATA